ncbi:MAG: hypothetical protein Ct9H300mP19_03710 [Dehalococcoidia bacterium]|nr:MAG: hypothetical protein Ct9H300mP19_03710 [Dehalococcoidia bacterium]
MDSEQVENHALVESALKSAEAALDIGLTPNQIIISCKVSRFPQMVSVYRELSERSDFPLHLGLTEAGMGQKGIVATTAALSTLLEQGIGDTIRASLTPEVGGDRSTEVRLCQDILQAIGLRDFDQQLRPVPVVVVLPRHCFVNLHRIFRLISMRNCLNGKAVIKVRNPCKLLLWGVL